jgi:hypothetical protein
VPPPRPCTARAATTRDAPPLGALPAPAAPPPVPPPRPAPPSRRRPAAPAVPPLARHARDATARAPTARDDPRSRRRRCHPHPTDPPLRGRGHAARRSRTSPSESAHDSKRDGHERHKSRQPIGATVHVGPPFHERGARPRATTSPTGDERRRGARARGWFLMQARERRSGAAALGSAAETALESGAGALPRPRPHPRLLPPPWVPPAGLAERVQRAPVAARPPRERLGQRGVRVDGPWRSSVRAPSSSPARPRDHLRGAGAITAPEDAIAARSARIFHADGRAQGAARAGGERSARSCTPGRGPEHPLVRRPAISGCV